MRRGCLGFALILGVAVGASTLMTVAHPAQAESESEYTRESVFLSGAGIYALQNAGQEWKNLDDTGGAEFRMGARLAPAVEVGVYVTWLYFDSRNPVSTGALLKIFPFEAFDMSLLDGVLQPYAIGMAGATFVEERSGSKLKAGGDMRGGAGVDFYLTPDVALFGEVHYSGAGGVPSGIESTNFLAGLTWRFDTN